MSPRNPHNVTVAEKMGMVIKGLKSNRFLGNERKFDVFNDLPAKAGRLFWP